MQRVSSSLILVAATQPVIRSGICAIIATSFPRASFIECNSMQVAPREVAAAHPDLAFLVSDCEEDAVLEALEKLTHATPKTPLVIMSICNDDSRLLCACERGGTAFLRKHVDREHVIDAVAAALRMRPDDGIASHLKEGKGSYFETLSSKERDIFFKLASGMALKEIAAILEISPKTVTTHRSRILKKMKLESNAALVRFALLAGMVK